MRHRLLSLFSFWKNLQHSMRVFILIEPLWSIPYNLYAPYFTLYLLEIGFSNTMVGWFSTAFVTTKLAVSLVAGYLVDRIGRRKALLCSNLLCWTFYLIVMLFARTPTALIFAAVCGGFVQVGVVSLQCYIAEEADAQERVDVVTWTYLVGMISGFFAPLGGLVIGYWGLVTGERLLLILAAVMMTAQFTIRHLSIRETQAGIAARSHAKTAGISSAFLGYGEAFRVLLHQRRVQLTTLMYAAVQFMLTLRTVWQSVFLVQRLGVPQQQLAWVPLGGSVLFILLTPLVNSLFRGRRQNKGSFWFGVVNLVLSVALLMLPYARNGWDIIIAVAGMALFHCGSVLLMSYAEAGVLNAVPEQGRARTMGLVGTLAMLVTAPAGILGGWLAERSIALPFIVIAALSALCVGCGLILGRKTA